MSHDFHAHLESDDFPCDDIAVFRLRGREAISELFRFEVHAMVREGELPAEAAPGANVTLVLLRDGEAMRRIHGILASVETDLDVGLQQPAYRLTIVPRAHRLTLVEQQDIHMELTVPEIAAAVLERVGLGSTDVAFRTLASYPAREFTVQYRETDLDFLGRLTEHDGISWFFVHEDGVDKITFVDDVTGFEPVPGVSGLTTAAALHAPDRLLGLRERRSMVPSHYLVHDYNYRRPDATLQGRADADDGHGGGVIEYGVHLKTNEEAARLAGVRRDERLCRQRVFEGSSLECRLTAGHQVELAAEGFWDGGRAVVLTSVEHEAELPIFGAQDKQPSYQNHFSAVTTDFTFRPERRTPRPRIFGVLSGVVQGVSDGAAAKLDEHGRYTVEFHFDAPLAAGRQRTSRQCRRIQPFGGTTHGMHFPLRPGSEVMIAFVDGDPDRPVIVGAVPNMLAPSPVTAKNARRNRITTNSGALFEISEKV